MRIDLLDSGSKGNACLVRSQSTTILIDCGCSTKKYLMDAMKQCGVQIEDIDAVLITHSHSDHIRQLRHFASKPIYACCQLKAKSTKGEDIPLDVRSVHPPDEFDIGALHILALPTSHDSGPSMGFVIHDGQESLVYMTDTGYVPASQLPDLAGASYYIFESNHDLEMLDATKRPMWLKQRIAADTGHLCNEDSAKVLARCVNDQTRDIVLAHLSEEANTPQKALDVLHKRLEFSNLAWHSIHIQAAAQQTIITLPSKPEQTSTQSPSLRSYSVKPPESPY